MDDLCEYGARHNALLRLIKLGKGVRIVRNAVRGHSAGTILGLVLLLAPLAHAAGGFKVWNQSVNKPVTAADAAPAVSAASLDVVGVKNGVFDGELVVADDKPINGLKVDASALTGPGGTIPATDVQVRYAMPDALFIRSTYSLFDSLEEAAPVATPAAKTGSIQPVWIAVTVPADAKPGDYAGQIAISATGVAVVKVTLHLKVLDWALPPAENYAARMDFIVSPETEAMAYNMPLWSDAHLKLLDRTYSLLAPLACRTVYITAIRRTHFGNEHAMVRWVLGDDGELTPDLSIVEKYLDVVCARLKKLPAVVLCCWEPVESGGHAGSDTAVRQADRSILITVVDPKTGELSAQPGPAWGTPEAKQFWKKLTDAMTPVLQKRGLENSLLLGLAGDWRPTQQAMDDVSNGIPGAKWAGHSHLQFGGAEHKLHTYNMGMASILWGINLTPVDPTKGYCYGWSNPFFLTFYSRNELKQQQDPPLLSLYRLEVERWMGAMPNNTKGGVVFGAGASGLGRIGADFWYVLKDPKGRPCAPLAGCYPEVSWGQMSMINCVPWILGHGRNGAVPTVRSEVLRGGLQETEARVYLEKAWLDESAKAMLGEEIRSRVRATLDDRIRRCVAVSPPRPDEQSARVKSAEAIDVAALDKAGEIVFGLAAEVAAKYKGREPQPTLTRPDDALPRKKQ